MSRRGSSGKRGSFGQVGGQGSGLGRDGGLGSGSGGGRGKGRHRGRSRVMEHGTAPGVDVKTLSRQIEPAPYVPYDPSPVPGMSAPTSTERDIEALVSQADKIKAQLQTIYTRISSIQSGRGGDPTGIIDRDIRRKTTKATQTGEVAAVIDQNECINCGICANICPEGAITVEEVTVIDAQKCTGCGLCVDECPNEAIYLATPMETLRS